MTSRVKKPKTDTPLVEQRLSMRLSDQALKVLEDHEARILRLAGTKISRTQCVEALLALGAAAWEASEKTRFWSPGAVIEVGEHELVKARIEIEAKGAADIAQDRAIQALAASQKKIEDDHD